MMAWAVFEVLESQERLDQDRLAALLAERYEDDPSRGYGNGMHRLLSEVSAGRDWDRVASELFNDQGSRGNGAATRITPLGAYYADDLDQLVLEAARSSVVTHTHPEASHSAVVVALATALAWQARRDSRVRRGADFLDAVLQRAPSGPLQKALRLARDLPESCSAKKAAGLLGDGRRATGLDTVPLALWIAARHITNYERALWAAVEVGVDRDTLGSIIGGIIAQSVGYQGIPWEWRQRRENFEMLEPDPLFCDMEESGEELTRASSEEP